MNTPQQDRRSGFRFSVIDALVLIAGAGLSLWLHSIHFPLWWVVPMALGHFFLFCNVFLVWRRGELLWAGFFILNVAAHLVMNDTHGGSVLLWQSPVTLGVIIWQIRSPWYHGIFAERMNPRLADFLRGAH